MPAPKGNKFAVGNKGGGRHSQFDPNFVRRAELACRAGFTDRELVELFDVSLSAIEKWKRQHEDFRNALKVGKAEADNRVERSLYERAVDYNYEATKMIASKPNTIIEGSYQIYSRARVEIFYPRTVPA